MTFLRVAPLALALLASCSSGSPAAQPDAGGGLPSSEAITAFTRVTNLLVVPVNVEGTTALLGVDTGDPFVLLNPASFPQAPAIGNVSTLDVESDDLTMVPVLTTSDSPASPDPVIVLGGLLGCTVLCKGGASFDYRAPLFSVGVTPAPSGVEAADKVPFAFEGGGVATSGGESVTVPRSRIVVAVDVEGTKHTMIVDTGASVVTVNQALWTELTKDGRTQLSGGMVDTTSGVSTATAARAKSITLGGADVTGVVVSHDTAFDAILSATSSDAGETIEGSLGGTYLTHFFVAIDYAAREVSLARYTDASFIVDPAELVGLALATGNGYSVGRVFEGTDAAAKGVTVGDALVAIDGHALGGLSISEARLLLGGKVGSFRSVQFGAAAKLSNQTVSIRVDELLPLP